MGINLAALVQTAIAAVPDGIAATVTVKRTVPGVMNYLTDVRGPDSEEQFSLRGVILTPKPDAPRDVTRSDSKVREVLLAAADCTFRPASGHTLVLNSVTYNVVACKPLAPGGPDAMYRVTASQ